MKQTNPTTSSTASLPPTYPTRVINPSNGYLNERFTDHVSAPMEKIAADPVLCDWWLNVLFKMLTDNPPAPHGASSNGNPTGENMNLQLDAAACRKGLLAIETVKSRQNWHVIKDLFDRLDRRLWEKCAQSSDWRRAYSGLYDSKAGARYVSAFFEDANLVMVSHYGGVPTPP